MGLILIIILFIICTTPAAVLTILFTEKLDDNLSFQIFRACANDLELLNFALNFYICLCSAEVRQAFLLLFKNSKIKSIKFGTLRTRLPLSKANNPQTALSFLEQQSMPIAKKGNDSKPKKSLSFLEIEKTTEIPNLF